MLERLLPVIHRCSGFGLLTVGIQLELALVHDDGSWELFGEGGPGESISRIAGSNRSPHPKRLPSRQGEAGGFRVSWRGGWILSRKGPGGLQPPVMASGNGFKLDVFNMEPEHFMKRCSLGEFRCRSDLWRPRLLGNLVWLPCRLAKQQIAGKPGEVDWVCTPNQFMYIQHIYTYICINVFYV